MKVGELAPDFTLQNQDGEDFQLSDFKGQNVILYFYGYAENTRDFSYVDESVTDKH